MQASTSQRDIKFVEVGNSRGVRFGHFGLFLLVVKCPRNGFNFQSIMKFAGTRHWRQSVD